MRVGDIQLRRMVVYKPRGRRLKFRRYLRHVGVLTGRNVSRDRVDALVAPREVVSKAQTLRRAFCIAK